MRALDVLQTLLEGLPATELQRAEFLRRNQRALLRRTRTALGLTDDLDLEPSGLSLIQAVYGAYGREVPPDNAVISVGGLVRDFYAASGARANPDVLRLVKEAEDELRERGLLVAAPRRLSAGGSIDFLRAADFLSAQHIWRSRMEPVLERWLSRSAPSGSRTRMRRQPGLG